jgi:choline dehydrogenase
MALMPQVPAEPPTGPRPERPAEPPDTFDSPRIPSTKLWSAQGRARARLAEAGWRVVVLKAHTPNRAGVVTLRSRDATEPPAVDFRYFDITDAPKETDLKAVVEGIHVARRLAAPLLHSGAIAEEEVQGLAVQGDAALEQFVHDHAWGHHACGTCAVGDVDKVGVLGCDFRVHRTAGLRVVDASVFPRIPGYFIASAVYMIAEKAADIVLADAME